MQFQFHVQFQVKTFMLYMQLMMSSIPYTVGSCHVSFFTMAFSQSLDVCVNEIHLVVLMLAFTRIFGFTNPRQHFVILSSSFELVFSGFERRAKQ